MAQGGRKSQEPPLGSPPLGLALQPGPLHMATQMGAPQGAVGVRRDLSPVMDNMDPGVSEQRCNIFTVTGHAVRAVCHQLGMHSWISAFMYLCMAGRGCVQTIF